MSYQNNGFEYYHTPRNVSVPNSRCAPVPGWGMDPRRAGPRMIGVGSPDGLGYDLKISTPVGTQTIKVPIEGLIASAAEDAIAAVWPPVKKKLEGELPIILAAASKEVTNNLLPKIMPTLQAEIDKILTRVERDLMIGLGVLAVGGLGIAIYLKRKGKKATPNRRRRPRR